MSNTGKGPDYGYASTANLVLERDRRPRVREPTGEAKSLAGKIDATRMGDRAGATRSAELEERLKGSKKRRSGIQQDAMLGRTFRAKRDKHSADLLSEIENLQGSSYRPRTKETQESYDLLLTVIKRCLGDQPEDILVGAADEVLAIMKTTSTSTEEKNKSVSELLGSLSEENFARITTACDGITDFIVPSIGGGAAAGSLDEEMGVAVVFDDELGESDEEDGVLREEDDEQFESDEAEMATEGVPVGVDTVEGGSSIMSSFKKSVSLADSRDVLTTDEGLIPLHTLDAYWLQRELQKFYHDATVSQEIAAKVMDIFAMSMPQLRKEEVAHEPSEEVKKGVIISKADDMDMDSTDNAKNHFVPGIDQREVETRLVEVLDYDKFDLVQVLLTNIARIYYVTKLKLAANEEQREQIKEQMRVDDVHDGVSLLREIEFGASAKPDALTRPRRDEKVPGDAVAAAQTQSLPSPDAMGHTVINLEQLSTLHTAAHATTAVVLPENTWRVQKKGYEEVHIPAYAPRPLEKGEREIAISELPEWAQPAFAGMKALNRVQSKLYPKALFSPENLLLCAPTGAGKTNVAMLTILHELGMHRSEDGQIDLNAFKIVYVAPMKALVQEVVANLSQRLGGPYGIQVRELSGDQNLTKAEIASTQIIVTTPEKWDVITRKAGDRSFLSLVRLVIIDEVHLLHDERGAVLEALVARILRQVEASGEHVRIVGLSATLPNFKDVSNFLRVDPSSGLFYFDPSYRPCPLQQLYIGVTETKPLRRLALMNDICYERVAAQAGISQSIVFVHSRKETYRTAVALKERFQEADTLSKLVPETSASREILLEEAEKSIKNSELKEVLPFGIGIHHAGLPRSDRVLVEELFADGHLQILVSTATLAWGVNLPAHTVVIKGTQVYSPEKGSWTELSPLDMLQMLGRAGRPQFDTFGEGVIITEHTSLQYYLSLVNSQLPIESQLASRLPDALNAEIVLGNVNNIEEAAAWLGYTYFFVRMQANPALYGCDPAMLKYDPTLYRRRKDLAHSAALVLDKNNLIRYDRRTERFHSTALGRVASYYYVSHTSIATYNEHLTPTLNEIDLLRLFSLSSEFKNIIVRADEKEELQKLMNRVPIPTKEAIDDPAAKVNILLQCYISRLPLEGYVMGVDMTYVHQSGGRIMRAIFEIALRRGWAELARTALNFSKMIHHRQWSSLSPLRQFSSAGGVSEEVIRRLERKDLPWDRYYDLSPSDIGELVKSARLGRPIHRLIHSLPHLEITSIVSPITRSLLRVQLTIHPDFIYDADNIHGPTEPFWIFVEDTNGERILHVEYFVLRASHAEEEHTLTFTLPLTDPLPPQYFLRVVSDRWLASESTVPLSFRDLILPEKFPPPTRLLDLTPMPLRDVPSPEAVNVYSSEKHPGGPIVRLTPIQTQIMPYIFQNKNNILVAAPSGAGKSLVAELAFFGALHKDPNAAMVWITPLYELQDLVFERLHNVFGGTLKKTVSKLTGELQSDLKLIENAHVVVATPAQYDAAFRRWSTNKYISSTSLFVFDHLELVGNTVTMVSSAGTISGHGIGGTQTLAASTAGIGANYEALITRIRLTSPSLVNLEGNPTNPRIVGLSTPLANAADIAAWLGCTPATTYAFAPESRLYPLELRITGLDSANPMVRAEALSKPVYNAVKTHAAQPPQRGLVFCSSIRQCKVTAIDLIAYATADNTPDLFIKNKLCSFSAMEKFLSAFSPSSEDGSSTPPPPLPFGLAPVHDDALLHCLKHGIGYWYATQPAHEAALVRILYKSGCLSVVCVPFDVVWSMDMVEWPTSLVVVAGTEAYEGGAKGWVEYELADVLRMVSRAAFPEGHFPTLSKSSLLNLPLSDDQISILGQKAHAAPFSRFQSSEGVTKCVLLCPETRVEYLKKFLFEPLPIESSLPLTLTDAVNTDMVTGVITGKEAMMDWLTWTLYFRRLTANPSYYGLTDNSEQYLSDYLSETVDKTVDSLQISQALDYDDENDVFTPLPLGRIAQYYNVKVTTMELFASSMTARTRNKGILEIISIASEFSPVVVRSNEVNTLRKMANHLPLALPPPPAGKTHDSLFLNPSIKVFILLQCHLSRIVIRNSDLRNDLKQILPIAIVLLNACVDIASTSGWWRPAIAAIEVSQSIVQALWVETDSPLLQLPGFDNDTIAVANDFLHVHAAKSKGVASEEEEVVESLESVYDFLSIPPSLRSSLLQSCAITDLSSLSSFCSKYPSVHTSYRVVLPTGEVVEPCEDVEEDLCTEIPLSYPPLYNDTMEEDSAPPLTFTLQFSLDREAVPGVESGGPRSVAAPRFPQNKKEHWWLVVGNAKKNVLIAIRRVILDKDVTRVRLKVALPESAETIDMLRDGTNKIPLRVLLLCDSYVGVDQEYNMEVVLKE